MQNVQFIRLLAEINAVGLSETQLEELSESMDLSVDDIRRTLESAERQFEFFKDMRVTNDQVTQLSYLSYEEPEVEEDGTVIVSLLPPTHDYSCARIRSNGKVEMFDFDELGNIVYRPGDKTLTSRGT